MDEKKPFWTSKTLWLNLGVVAMTMFMEHDNPETVATALGVANVILRFFTSKSLNVG